AGLQVFDCPTSSADPETLRRESVSARDLGFTGKACRTPAQARIVHEVFGASGDELKRAERIVAAADRATAGTLVVDGRMIEPPTILAMRRLLAAAKASS